MQSMEVFQSEHTFLTGRHEVISLGSSELSWPSSEAHVSAQQQAK